MARKKKGDGIGHNSEPAQVYDATARAALIQDAARRISNLEAEIKVLRENKAQIVAEIVKGKLGMKAADFKLALRAHKLEDDDRARYLDTLRECFQALGIGQQGDLFGAMAAPRREREDDIGEPAPAAEPEFA